MSNQYICKCGERTIKILKRTKTSKCPTCGRRMKQYDKSKGVPARLITFFNDGGEFEEG